MNSRVHLCLIIACRNLQPTSAHTNCLIDLLNSPEPPRDSGRRESPPQRGRVLYPPPHPWQLLSAPFYKHRQHSPKLFPRQHRQTATASARSAHYRERYFCVNAICYRTANFLPVRLLTEQSRTNDISSCPTAVRKNAHITRARRQNSPADSYCLPHRAPSH